MCWCMLTWMTDHPITLTPAQQRVARLLDSGLTVRQIAKALDISTQAVYKTMKSAGIAPAAKATK